MGSSVGSPLTKAFHRGRSGFDASEHTQGFGIEPYFVYSPPMVVIARYVSSAGCRSCFTVDVSELVSLTQ